MKAGIVQESEFVRITKPIDGSGACGLDIPLKVQAFQIDQASSRASHRPAHHSRPRRARICASRAQAGSDPHLPHGRLLDDWLATAVQPAALAWMGQGVKEIRTGGSYACRRRNHQPGAKLSEHAFGNAIDIISFVFADGSVTTVKGGWRGSANEQGFLREVLNSACGKFRTVLGPGSDAFHHDHFHLDLARHDARGQRRYCRPKVEALQRPAFPPNFNTQMPPATAFNTAPQPQGFPNNAYSATHPRGAHPAHAGSIVPVGLAGSPQQMLQRDTRSGGEVIEQEGEFDPRDFDVTSLMPDLPVSRGRGVTQQTDSGALLRPAAGLLEAAEPSGKAPARNSAVVRQPTMPMGGN